ncbi:hypothetical protein HMPREF7215_1496 [Pyramidobacter piscolens W5455]|uniref:Uncharacterized protein n=1 Tax=Pyramidobacter piscolens W5455 TaxID=352165 RepID=A0ABP2HWG4_9BACT|nr:hypothetical protein HMPREF7215_1496 [Pyramidobacter piscolens W5455]
MLAPSRFGAAGRNALKSRIAAPVQMPFVLFSTFALSVINAQSSLCLREFFRLLYAGILMLKIYNKHTIFL